jgi:hypothetical protein
LQGFTNFVSEIRRVFAKGPSFSLAKHAYFPEGDKFSSGVSGAIGYGDYRAQR